MKKTFNIVLLCLLSGFCSSQTVDFDQVISPLENRAKTFEDYLVQLAWHNSPKNKQLHTEVSIADNEIQLEKKKWAKDINASFNINEVSLSKLIYGDQIDIPVFYPIYNFTASVNLGTFINRKHEVENAKFEKLIAEEDINQEKLELRSDVLQRYNEYLLTIEVLTTRSLAEENAYETYKLLSEQFKGGKAELEDFTRASGTYFSAMEARQQAQTDVRLSEVKVEELIGISLEKAKRLGPKEEGKKN